MSDRIFLLATGNLNVTGDLPSGIHFMRSLHAVLFPHFNLSVLHVNIPTAIGPTRSSDHSARGFI